MSDADTASAPLRAVIADDQTLVRTGFRLILNEAGITVAAEAANGKEAVAAVLQHRPDVVLMDIRMPEMDGLEATRRILASKAGCGCRIIILTTFDLDQYVYAALTAGASGFLLKDTSPEQLVAAVRTVRSGDALLAPSITRRLIERFAPHQPGQFVSHAGLSDLTARELQVLRLLARGLSNAELAAELTVSTATVKTHVASILAKLQLRDRVQAIVLAYQAGLAGPPPGNPPPPTVAGYLSRTDRGLRPRRTRLLLAGRDWLTSGYHRTGVGWLAQPRRDGGVSWVPLAGSPVLVSNNGWRSHG